MLSIYTYVLGYSETPPVKFLSFSQFKKVGKRQRQRKKQKEKEKKRPEKKKGEREKIPILFV